jgi:hypothetical protein
VRYILRRVLCGGRCLGRRRRGSVRYLETSVRTHTCIRNNVRPSYAQLVRLSQEHPRRLNHGGQMNRMDCCPRRPTWCRRCARSFAQNIAIVRECWKAERRVVGRYVCVSVWEQVQLRRHLLPRSSDVVDGRSDLGSSSATSCVSPTSHKFDLFHQYRPHGHHCFTISATRTAFFGLCTRRGCQTMQIFPARSKPSIGMMPAGCMHGEDTLYML